MTQRDARGDFVDVLAARTRGVAETLLQLVFIQVRYGFHGGRGHSTSADGYQASLQARTASLGVRSPSSAAMPDRRPATDHGISQGMSSVAAVVGDRSPGGARPSRSPQPASRRLLPPLGPRALSLPLSIR